MVDIEQFHREVCAFLHDTLGVQVGDIGPDTELITTGLLDSMSVVRLAAYLERRFQLVIPDLDIEVDHFNSISKISSYLEARLGS